MFELTVTIIGFAREGQLTSAFDSVQIFTMASINLYVRLRSGANNQEEGTKTCKVDISKGLPHVLKQISSRFNVDAIGLSNVIFKGGVDVGTSEIDCVDVLRDDDIVEIIEKKKKQTPSPRRSCNNKKKKKCPSNNNDNLPPPKYEEGTKVRNIVGDKWIDGTIWSIDYIDRKYEVQYSNGLSEWFDFHDKKKIIDKMVFHGKKKDVPPSPSSERQDVKKRKRTMNNSSPKKKTNHIRRNNDEDVAVIKYKTGTKVRKYFHGYDWYDGEIISTFIESNNSKPTAYYEIRYSDGDEETMGCGPELDKIVREAEEFRRQESIKAEHQISSDGPNDEVQAIVEEFRMQESIKTEHQHISDGLDDDVQANSDEFQREESIKPEHQITPDGIDDHDVQTNPEDLDDDSFIEEATRSPSTKKRERASRLGNKNGSALTKEQRKRLKNVELNLVDFEKYLQQSVLLNKSSKYFREILKYTKQLKNRDKITYAGWPEGISFYFPAFEDMSTNFFEMYHAFRIHEEKYGKMKSHLLPRLIRMLGEFQVYLVYGFTPCRMSEEYRSKLSGEEFDLNDFKNFLVNQHGIRGGNLKDLYNRVRHLKRGEGIRNCNWADGILFHPKPICLDENFHLLLQDAISHEKKYGEAQNSVLRHPIRKLIAYQEFYYKRKFTSEVAQDVLPSIVAEPTVQVEQPKAVLSMQPAAAEAAQHSVHPSGEAIQETQNAEAPTIHEEQPAAVLSMSEDTWGFQYEARRNS